MPVSVKQSPLPGWKKTIQGSQYAVLMLSFVIIPEIGFGGNFEKGYLSSSRVS
jgi:hypothetical protein